jgi:hypothetical protein
MLTQLRREGLEKKDQRLVDRVFKAITDDEPPDAAESES